MLRPSIHSLHDGLSFATTLNPSCSQTQNPCWTVSTMICRLVKTSSHSGLAQAILILISLKEVLVSLDKDDVDYEIHINF